MLPRSSSQEAQREEYSCDFLRAMDAYRLVGDISSPDKRGSCAGILSPFRAQSSRISTSIMLAVERHSRSAAVAQRRPECARTSERQRAGLAPWPWISPVHWSRSRGEMVVVELKARPPAVEPNQSGNGSAGPPWMCPCNTQHRHGCQLHAGCGLDLLPRRRLRADNTLSAETRVNRSNSDGVSSPSGRRSIRGHTEGDNLGSTDSAPRSVIRIQPSSGSSNTRAILAIVFVAGGDAPCSQRATVC